MKAGRVHGSLAGEAIQIVPTISPRILQPNESQNQKFALRISGSQILTCLGGRQLGAAPLRGVSTRTAVGRGLLGLVGDGPSSGVPASARPRGSRGVSWGLRGDPSQQLVCLSSWRQVLGRGRQCMCVSICRPLALLRWLGSPYTKVSDSKVFKGELVLSLECC